MIGSILSKVKFQSDAGGRPPAAVELTPEGALAAALPGPGQPAVYAFAPLPAGALLPGIGEPNLRMPEAVAGAIHSALSYVSPRSRAVTLIVPDSVVRVFVLDFDALPAKKTEALPILRFRLRKMVPFDVEQTGLSYQLLSQTETECKVLAVILPIAILEEYEAAVQAAGYEPGAILPSSLATLEAIDTTHPALIANLAGPVFTTTIANGQDLLLYRSLDLPEDADARLAEIQRGVAVAAAYFEDKLGTRPEKLHYAGQGDAADFARWLNEQELAVVDLVPQPDTGAATALAETSIAGVVGALAGVR
jgi:type IV pilus assembly protein PilM